MIVSPYTPQDRRLLAALERHEIDPVDYAEWAARPEIERVLDIRRQLAESRDHERAREDVRFGIETLKATIAANKDLADARRCAETRRAATTIIQAAAATLARRGPPRVPRLAPWPDLDHLDHPPPPESADEAQHRTPPTAPQQQGHRSEDLATPVATSEPAIPATPPHHPQPARHTPSAGHQVAAPGSGHPTHHSTTRPLGHSPPHRLTRSPSHSPAARLATAAGLALGPAP